MVLNVGPKKKIIKYDDCSNGKENQEIVVRDGLVSDLLIGQDQTYWLHTWTI